MISYENSRVHLGRTKQFLRSISRPLAILPLGWTEDPPITPKPLSPTTHTLLWGKQALTEQQDPCYCLHLAPPLDSPVNSQSL